MAGAEQDVTAREMAKAVLAVVRSSHFDKEEIRQNKLTLSQAYCLLWLDSESGDVCGRKCCAETNGCVTAAALVDLVVLGRAEVDVVPNKTLGIKNDHIIFKVLSDTLTGTYLDGTHLFQSISTHYKNPENPKQVKDWIIRDISKLMADQKCTTPTLQSLVDLGILEKEKTAIGFKYPTAKPGIKEALVRDIRTVVLEEAQPSSYIRALLTLACASDNLLCGIDPILKKYFSKEEYGKVKNRIKELLVIDKKEEGKI